MTSRVVKVTFLGDTTSLSKSYKTMEKDAGSASKSTGGLLGNLGKMIGAFGLLSLGETAGKAIVDTFNADQQAAVSLKQAMDNAGEAAGPVFAAKLAQAQSAGESLGFASADTTNALAALTTAGVGTAQGIASLPAIYNLAAHAHLSLADATKDVILGMQGQGRSLKELNIALPASLPTLAQLTAAETAHVAAIAKYGPKSEQASAALQKVDTIQAALSDRTKNLTAVTDVLQKKLGGDAASAAATAGGQLNVLKVTVEDAGAQLLNGMMPAINAVIGVLSGLTQHMNIVLPVLVTVIGLFGAWKAAMAINNVVQSLQKGIGSIVSMFAGQAAATEGATGAQEGLNTAMDANPIGIIVVAIAALVAGFILLYTHVKGFRDIVNAVFGWVIGFIKGAISIIVGLFQTTPFGFLITHLTQLKQFVQTIIGDVISFFTALPGEIGTALGGIFNFVTAPFKTAFDWIANLWNNTLGKIAFTIPGWVPVIGGDRFGFPQIPTFHTGGVIPGPMGTPVPATLLAGERVLSPSESRVSGGGGSSSRPIIVYAQTNADAHEIGREVAWAAKTAMAT